LRREIEKAAVTALNKFAVPYSTGTGFGRREPAPPYDRRVPPKHIYNIRRNQSLINNAIEEKVSQTFRRGFSDVEKEWLAKCSQCKAEFGEEDAFREQAGDTIPEDVDVDFSDPRTCPECEEMARMIEPDPERKEAVEELVELANAGAEANSILEPHPETGVGQSFLEVCIEVGWDIQSFDDGWLLFDRSYTVNESGHVLDVDLAEVHRAPPELMRYSIDEETGQFGGEYWACLRCRNDEQYAPETQPRPCSECGLKTYEVFAYATENPRADDPAQLFIRGEFCQRSEYEPSKYYGYSPIVTLADEARSLEHMDNWYQSAYEHRRAPRGVVAIKSSNAESTRKFNREQMEKLSSDPNHIPVMMDDSESEGDPMKFIDLLESPAEMQQMEMREWFKERISGKYGVTSILMSGAPEDSGLSQSMEVQVSNRSADRLRRIFNEGIIPAFLAQIGAEGWTFEVLPVEEEDEQREADLQHKELKNAEAAATLDLDVEWTDENRADIKQGEVEAPPTEGDGAGGGMGGIFGTGGESAPGAGAGTGFADEQGNQEGDPEAPTAEGGGGPATPPRPQRAGEPIAASATNGHGQDPGDTGDVEVAGIRKDDGDTPGEGTESDHTGEHE
jgi:hypothetical protein